MILKDGRIIATLAQAREMMIRFRRRIANSLCGGLPPSG
jgi:hypothetical protein